MDELRERVKSRSFRRAVGAGVAEEILALINYAECMPSVEELESLLNNYYVLKSRIRNFFDRLITVMGEDFQRALARIYALTKDERIGEVLRLGRFGESREYATKVMEAILAEASMYEGLLVDLVRRAKKCQMDGLRG